MRLNGSQAVCPDILEFAPSAFFTHSPVQKSTFIHNRLVCRADSDSALGVANKQVYKTFHSKSTR